MAEEPDERDSPEITPKMIEAAERALYDSGYGNEFLGVTASRAVREVLEAALPMGRRGQA